MYQGDTRDLPEYQSQPDIPTYVQETTKVPETGDTSGRKAFWDVFMSMTNFNILNDKKMVIICAVKNFLIIMIYYYYFFFFYKGQCLFNDRLLYTLFIYC